MSLSQVTGPLGGTADQMISAAVRGLIAQRRVNATEVAAAIGISRAALYRKLGEASPWWADEVDRLARFFAVSRDSLHEGRAEFRAHPLERAQNGGRASSDYGSEGWEFESLRARPFRRPNRRPNRRRRLSAAPLYLIADNAAVSA